MVGYGGWVGGGHRVWERWGRAGRHQGCLGTPALLVGVGTPAVQVGNAGPRVAGRHNVCRRASPNNPEQPAHAPGLAGAAKPLPPPLVAFLLPAAGPAVAAELGLGRKSCSVTGRFAESGVPSYSSARRALPREMGGRHPSQGSEDPAVDPISTADACKRTHTGTRSTRQARAQAARLSCALQGSGRAQEACPPVHISQRALRQQVGQQVLLRLEVHALPPAHHLARGLADQQQVGRLHTLLRKQAPALACGGGLWRGGLALLVPLQ